MDELRTYLALHGAIVLTIGLVAGLPLHRAIRLTAEQGGEKIPPWHLAHAGISARGVLLIALASIFPWVALPASCLRVAAGLWLFFVWTSTAAMTLAAATGERGLSWHGSLTSRLVFALYVVGALAVFPAALLLIAGLARAL